jgi:hypothetical protein
MTASLSVFARWDSHHPRLSLTFGCGTMMTTMSSYIAVYVDDLAIAYMDPKGITDN